MMTLDSIVWSSIGKFIPDKSKDEDDFYRDIINHPVFEEPPDDQDEMVLEQSQEQERRIEIASRRSE